LSIVTVTVVYLGRAREESGTKEDHFELQSPANVDKAFSEAINIHPGLAKMRELIRPLLNGQWANGKDELKNGDRLALMPPVGGG
jgi:molybdopterin converting factor small subunit